jgi:hypothetical protein
VRFLALAALLPGLYWEGGTEPAARLKRVGMLRVQVPPARVREWREAGFTAVGFTPSEASCGEADAPKVELRMDVASATGMPWITANGWRFLREPGRTWCYSQLEGAEELAAGEAYAYGVDAVVAAGDKQLEAFGAMLAFLRGIDRPAMRGMANIGVIDDGSDLTGEALNLMTRRNLAYRVLRAPDPALDLNVEPKDVGDPYAYAQEVRRKLGDEKRLVRLYGSEVVLARLTGDGTRARLHLLNYSGRPVLGLRVRVRGEWGRISLAVYGRAKAEAAEIARAASTIEFTVPEMGCYAVADLEK